MHPLLCKYKISFFHSWKNFIVHVFDNNTLTPYFVYIYWEQCCYKHSSTICSIDTYPVMGYIPNNGIAGSNVRLKFIFLFYCILFCFVLFLGNLYSIFQIGCTNFQSQQKHTVFAFLQILTRILLCLLDNSQWGWSDMSLWSLFQFFLLFFIFRAFFHTFVGHLYFFLWELLRSLGNFLIRLVVFCWVVLSSWCIQDMNIYRVS